MALLHCRTLLLQNSGHFKIRVMLFTFGAHAFYYTHDLRAAPPAMIKVQMLMFPFEPELAEWAESKTMHASKAFNDPIHRLVDYLLPVEHGQLSIFENFRRGGQSKTKGLYLLAPTPKPPAIVVSQKF